MGGLAGDDLEVERVRPARRRGPEPRLHPGSAAERTRHGAAPFTAVRAAAFMDKAIGPSFGCESSTGYESSVASIGSEWKSPTRTASIQFCMAIVLSLRARDAHVESRAAAARPPHRSMAGNVADMAFAARARRVRLRGIERSGTSPRRRVAGGYTHAYDRQTRSSSPAAPPASAGRWRKPSTNSATRSSSPAAARRCSTKWRRRTRASRASRSTSPTSPTSSASRRSSSSITPRSTCSSTMPA